MVRVYKTNVDDRSTARSILDEIRRTQPGSDPSFDLEDCDNVLRVENKKSGVDEPVIKEIIKSYGHTIEVLP